MSSGTSDLLFEEKQNLRFESDADLKRNFTFTLTLI
jgi:hypothetical protein